MLDRLGGLQALPHAIDILTGAGGECARPDNAPGRTSVNRKIVLYYPVLFG